jgi:integrase
LKISVKPEIWDDNNECLLINDNCKSKEEKEENKKRKENNISIEEYHNRALEIEFDYQRENNSEWTLNQYKEKLIAQPVQGKIEPYLKKHILTLKETNHHSTSINYNKLYNKLTLFDKEFIVRRFNEIDYSYVNNFSIWLEKIGVSNNTRAFYLKRLCAIFNKAIKSKQANASDYPFGRDGYIVSALATETRKRYMPTEYLEILKTQKANTPQVEYARHLFLLSYYCYGMSFKDMAVLSKRNIFKYNDGDYIVYKRLKTQEKKAKPISIKITDTIRSLIKFLTDYRKPLDEYLLPIITRQKDTSAALFKHINVVLRMYNKYLQDLANEFGFDMELTSYVSRHTTAMQLQEKKVPEHIISQMLGHKKLETTKVYLDSLDTSVIDEAVKVL